MAIVNQISYHLKEIEITKAAANYITQYQLKFSQIEENNITCWYRAELFPYLNNKKNYLLQAY